MRNFTWRKVIFHMAFVLLLQGALNPLAFAAVPFLSPYTRKPADRVVYMDSKGVLRWNDDNREVDLFGENYYPPFSIDYASLKAVGANPEKVIREDLTHFVRMGYDTLRLHVFDRQISDAEGRLIDNDHLRLLDYLIHQAKIRGIYTVLTAIAWWQVPGQSEGFSNYYTKQQMITNPNAVDAECTYLREFLLHKNPYDGMTYAADPAIPVLELFNEPDLHGLPHKAIIAYLNRLVDAVQSTGCKKPIFYNAWSDWLDCIAKSKVDGATFSWYPSGLLSGHELTSNFLGAVSHFPSMRNPLIANKAKIVYEFDAADIPTGYLYPAMARAFREGGAQIATQFQYDLLPLAPTNVDWQTHYMNLVYAPQKALGMMIAGEAFHTLPGLKGYGDYPQNDRFGDFRVSWRRNLAERLGTYDFLYSNTTQDAPPQPDKLRHIAGCGSSPIVKYAGTGAYFLDMVRDGVWRMEVYPDYVWVADPFGASNLQRVVSRIYWRSRAMTIHLPDLGMNYIAAMIAGEPSYDTVNEPKTDYPLNKTPFKARNGQIIVTPGVYILRRNIRISDPKGISTTFIAPPQRRLPLAVWMQGDNNPLPAGKALMVNATVAYSKPPSVILYYRNSDNPRFLRVPMKETRPFQFSATVNGRNVRKGVFTYCIGVKSSGKEIFYPQPDAGGLAGRFQLRPPVYLLRFHHDSPLPKTSLSGSPGQTVKDAWVSCAEPGGDALEVDASGFGVPPACSGLRFRVPRIPKSESACNVLVVRVRRTTPYTSGLEVGLVEDNGDAYGYVVPLSDQFTDVRIPLSQLNPLWNTKGGSVKVHRVSEISLTFGAWLDTENAAKPQGYAIDDVRLEYQPPVRSIPIVGEDGPLPLLTASSQLNCDKSAMPYQLDKVFSSHEHALVWRLGMPNAEGMMSVRENLRNPIDSWKGMMDGWKDILVRIRASEPTTSAIEIVFQEDDGTPWGITPQITTQWQTLRIPVRSLQLFTWWHITPAGRGGAGDYCHLDHLTSIIINQGKWLYPQYADESHAVEIESIQLSR